MEAIVVEIEDDDEAVEAIVVEEFEELIINILDPTEKKETRLAWNGPYCFIGKASNGSAEDVAVWKIYRIEVLPAGTVNTKTAVGIKWVDYLTETYN